MDKRKVVIPVGPSIAYVPLTRGLYALIDVEDAERIGLNNWNASLDSAGVYRAFRHVVGTRSIRGMHAEIMGRAGHGVTVDHVAPKNGLDNRRINLRYATKSQQQWNQSRPRNNTSGLKGVCFDRGRWKAQIGVHGKPVNLGYFNSVELAHAAYCNAALRLYGEFARAA